MTCAGSLGVIVCIGIEQKLSAFMSDDAVRWFFAIGMYAGMMME